MIADTKLGWKLITCPLEGWNCYALITKKQRTQSIRTTKFISHQHKKIIKPINLNKERLLKQTSLVVKTLS